MPRGFLVKRRDYVPYSYRQRRHSEEDPSDSGSDHDYPTLRNLGSPDSGYSLSPSILTYRDHVFDGESSSGGSTPTSPLSGTLTPLYGSPFFSTFDQLTLTSPKSLTASPLNASAVKKRGSCDVDKHRSAKRSKAVRKLNFDEDLTSPVSGTVIRPLKGNETEDEDCVSGDIDSSLNWVDISPEARAELSKIENKIGDYLCMLCKEQYDDAFMLAQHKCSRIVYVEYKCPECDKVFNCPANLASHRRWHKPRPSGNKSPVNRSILPVGNKKENDQPSSPGSPEAAYECETCGKKFKRRAYLRKHRNKHTVANKTTLPLPSASSTSKENFTNSNVSHTSKSFADFYSKAMSNFRCLPCNLTFPDEQVMEMHHRRQHVTLDSAMLTCNICSEYFCTSSELSNHVTKCHTNEHSNLILASPDVLRTA